MRPGLAVVTGASSGIGEAIARELVRRQRAVLLVARSKEKLEERAASWRTEGGPEIGILSLDLTDPGAPQELFDRTEGAGRQVDLLVNNAGFGWNGPQTELPIARVREMLALNVAATTELTHLFLGAMAARRGGAILNVGSTAGFLSIPYFAEYAATKAYILSFTLALHEEAKRSGVTVTCLCPGYTRTAFNVTARMKGAGATPFPEMSAERVAAIGLRALDGKKPFVVTHPLDSTWIFLGRFLPRSFGTKLAALVFQRTRL